MLHIRRAWRTPIAARIDWELPGLTDRGRRRVIEERLCEQAALVAERDWLTVVLPPGYAPELNPVEGMWAHIKRSLANLAARTLSELETLLRRRLKALQYRHGILGGLLAGTSLALDRPN